MRVLIANFKNECCKLFAKKKYIVFLIIAVAICSFNVISGKIISLISRGMIDFAPANIAMSMLSFFAEIFVPFILFMAITDLFSSEMHDLTIKASLMRPISRFKIMISKTAAAVALSCIYFLAVLLTSSLLEGIFGSWSNMFANFGVTLASYAIDVIPLIVLALAAVLINMFCKSSTLSILLCIALYAGMKYCYYFVPSIGNIFFTAYMQWHRLWIGAMIPFGAMMSKIGVILGSGILLATASSWLFDKKEF